jgi:heptosyltransferase-2
MNASGVVTISNGNATRVLVICPSWVGDAAMATPALRLLRANLPGAFIGGLLRPGIDQVLAGLDVFDETHVERASGVMGPKFVAAKVRPRRYDAALLLTNSFSSALIARIAGIPRRMGYDRDARRLLLTHRLKAPASHGAAWKNGRWKPVPAVAYYWHAARSLLVSLGRVAPLAPDADPFTLPREARLELVATEHDRAAAREVLFRARIDPEHSLVILNPGGNREEKRWPAERFAAIGAMLLDRGITVLVNGSPAEAPLVRGIVERARGGKAKTHSNTPQIVSLPDAGGSIASLKGILASPRVRVMLTNDTGPRHLAAAFAVRVVTLFGPTDHRWTTIPVAPGLESILLADPTLPEDEVADEHPERCRIDRIALSDVVRAMEGMLDRAEEKA